VPAATIAVAAGTPSLPRRSAIVQRGGMPDVHFADALPEARGDGLIRVRREDQQTIRGVTNPDKLEHLGPVLDAREVLRTNRP
jgi:hypothetical protein